MTRGGAANLTPNSRQNSTIYIVLCLTMVLMRGDGSAQNYVMKQEDKQNPWPCLARDFPLCGANGTRTRDPHTASVVRYQLRHSPSAFRLL